MPCCLRMHAAEGLRRGRGQGAREAEGMERSQQRKREWPAAPAPGATSCNQLRVLSCTESVVPLCQALTKGHLKVARHLMLYKADLWKRVNDQTAVSLALEHPDGLQLLIDTHPDDEALAPVRAEWPEVVLVERMRLPARTPRTWRPEARSSALWGESKIKQVSYWDGSETTLHL